MAQLYYWIIRHIYVKVYIQLGLFMCELLREAYTSHYSYDFYLKNAPNEGDGKFLSRTI